MYENPTRLPLTADTHGCQIQKKILSVTLSLPAKLETFYDRTVKIH